MRSTTPVILIDEEEDYSHVLPTSLDTEELLDTPQDISDSFSQSQTDAELDLISPSDLTMSLSESTGNPIPHVLPHQPRKPVILWLHFHPENIYLTWTPFLLRHILPSFLMSSILRLRPTEM